MTAAVAQSGMHLSRGGVEAIIRLGDRNGDGRINAAEWEVLAAVWADIASLRAELDVGEPVYTAAAAADEAESSLEYGLPNYGAVFPSGSPH